MTKVITTGNFKGGVGKTTNAVMISYELSNMGKKVLMVDFDPQANTTDLLFTTMKKVLKKDPVYEITLANAIFDHQDLRPALINVKENLDLLPSYKDLQAYERFLYDNFSDDYSMDNYFNKLLKEIKSDYDFVIIDVPPQMNKFTDSAFVASDYVIIILQTQERSLKGAETYVDHLLQLTDDYDLATDVLGVLPVLMQNGSDLDKDVIDDAVDSFQKQNLFKNHIKQMARLKRFDREGITNNNSDVHDKNVHKVYINVVEEMLERIELLQK
ncbi:ParA family protein [Listeria booriae]|uniref:AAA family ATPase n=1 Tax=Listeria booriae TaxID=1552123 RepID=A0A841Y362_9LIST|nr:AAA family ATPase [Listeria booriae]MBC1318521.1 AAA family ATPase [Listeria booriae]MBC1890049.1 AAA family ATPase [Listeria booriae]MBC2388830.1 AAA family ATPase [Listeria booriae]